jgi:hypothetical protein
MTHSITLDPSGRHIEIGYEGIVDYAGILRAVREAVANPGFNGFIGIIWDFRNASLSDMTLQAMQTVWREQSDLPLNAGTRIAVVFSQPINAPLLRLWQSAASATTMMERRHFSDMEAARRWVDTGADPGNTSTAS